MPCGKWETQHQYKMLKVQTFVALECELVVRPTEHQHERSKAVKSNRPQTESN